MLGILLWKISANIYTVHWGLPWPHYLRLQPTLKSFVLFCFFSFKLFSQYILSFPHVVYIYFFFKLVFYLYFTQQSHVLRILIFLIDEEHIKKWSWKKGISLFRKFNLLKINICSKRLASIQHCLIIKVVQKVAWQNDVLDLGSQYGAEKGENKEH